MIFDDRAVAEQALQLFQVQGAYLCNDAEKALLEAVMFDKERGVPAMRIIGKAPQTIALLAGFTVPDEIKLLMVPLTTSGPEEWLSYEKLSPVLGWYIVDSKEEAIAAAVTQLEFGGAGSYHQARYRRWTSPPQSSQT